MSTESIALVEWEDRLAKSIGKLGLSLSPKEVMAVLADAAEPSPVLTAQDRAFLVEHAGLTKEDLSSQSLQAADVEIAANRSAAARDVQAESFNTQQVAQMLKMAPANVRRAVLEGSLYSVKTSPGGHHWFPHWQFTHERMLPGLRDVVAALPDNYHPVEVESFMTEGSDVLRGMTPAEWLSSGGDVATVVALADERAWE